MKMSFTRFYLPFPNPKIFCVVMPELAEIHIYSTKINEWCSGRSFSQVYVQKPCTKRPGVPPLTGGFTIQAYPRGKELKLTFTSTNGETLSLVFNHALEGGWHFTAGVYPAPYTLLSIVTSDGNHRLCFADRLKLANWRQGDWDKNERGPDPLLEYEEFRLRILKRMPTRARNKPVGELMLDQKYFNGIGNYLRSEILTRACISPKRKFGEIFRPTKVALEGGQEINVDKGQLLLALCRAVPQEVLDNGLNKYGTQEEQDKFHKWLRCYGKEGAKSEKGKQGRTIWYFEDIETRTPDPADLSYLNVLPSATPSTSSSSSLTAPISSTPFGHSPVVVPPPSSHTGRSFVALSDNSSQQPQPQPQQHGHSGFSFGAPSSSSSSASLPFSHHSSFSFSQAQPATPTSSHSTGSSQPPSLFGPPSSALPSSSSFLSSAMTGPASSHSGRSFVVLPDNSQSQTQQQQQEPQPQQPQHGPASSSSFNSGFSFGVPSSSSSSFNSGFSFGVPSSSSSASSPFSHSSFSFSQPQLGTGALSLDLPAISSSSQSHQFPATSSSSHSGRSFVLPAAPTPAPTASILQPPIFNLGQGQANQIDHLAQTPSVTEPGFSALSSASSALPTVSGKGSYSPIAKLLLLASLLAKTGLITNKEKLDFKEVVLRAPHCLPPWLTRAPEASLEYFEAEHDLAEVADTVQRVVGLYLQICSAPETSL
jgi:endonuclease VIII-like 1